jgi:hypothetical protein
MKHFIIVFMAVMASCALYAQGFPDAQKQPRFKEQKPHQKKFKKWSHRRHVKRGTVYMQNNGATNPYTWVCILNDDRSLLKTII